MKKHVFLMALCLSLALCLPAFALEAPTYDAMAMETDPAAFAQTTGLLNWQIPAGYTLEAFVKGDLSHDEYADSAVASLVAGDGTGRMLAVLVGNPFDQHVFTSLAALPQKAAVADAFLGLSTSPGCFTIYTGEGQEDFTRTGYTFGYHGGRFYLDNIFVDSWDQSTMLATQRVFLLDMGSYALRTGRMQDGAFVSEGTQEQHQFSPDDAVFALEEFDIDAFPTDWNGFESLISGRAKPTAKPSSRPRPTHQPMPGPVYPTDDPMPGPVYPTDEPMPGPIYPDNPIEGEASTEADE